MQRAVLNRVAKLMSRDPSRLAVPREVANREELLSRFCRTVFDIRGIYVTAAFRSSVKNEAYLFMNKEYVVLNYAPGTQNDKVLDGPNLICKGFPSLAGTSFCYCGIDCAFGSHHGSKAYIFSGNSCAHIDYAPGTNDLKILKKSTINRMFPFLRGTEFEDGVDAAFESSANDEAYLFNGNKCAHINYLDGGLISINPTLACLKNTKFEDRIDAAFASHRTNEAYVFKEDSYARINFADGYIIGDVKKILPDEWPALNGILPRENCAKDHDH